MPFPSRRWPGPRERENRARPPASFEVRRHCSRWRRPFTAYLLLGWKKSWHEYWPIWDYTTSTYENIKKSLTHHCSIKSFGFEMLLINGSWWNVTNMYICQVFDVTFTCHNCFAIPLEVRSAPHETRHPWSYSMECLLQQSVVTAVRQSADKHTSWKKSNLKPKLCELSEIHW